MESRPDGPRRARARRRSGFTLLEAAFGIVVLSVSLLAAFTSQVLSLNLVRTARESNTATSELSAALEEITAPGIDAIPGAFPAGAPLAKFQGRALRDEAVTIDYPGLGGAATANPLEIVVTITWTAWNGRARALRLATMKAR